MATKYVPSRMLVVDEDTDLVVGFADPSQSGNQVQLLGEGGGGSGSVTSVALSVPTGLTIGGSPVTSTGTLAVGLDTGYVIPTQETLDAKVVGPSSSVDGRPMLFDSTTGKLAKSGIMRSADASDLDWTTLGAYEVNIALGPQKTPTMSAIQTITFSGTPPDERVFGPVRVYADSGGPYVLTIPSSIDMDNGGTITTVSVPASGSVTLTWERDGANNLVYGVPGSGIGTQTGMIPLFIRTVADETLRLVINTPVALTITNISTRSASGTCTVTGQIDGTPLGGTANSASTTEQSQAHSSANVMSVGSDFLLAFTSNSACTGLAVNVHYTWALA